MKRENAWVIADILKQGGDAVSFKDLFDELLSEQTEDALSMREAIARSITQKAVNGDLSAVKFLRETVDGEKQNNDTIDIRIKVVD